MKPISTSVYSFENLIKRGHLYVDKSKYIYQLVSDASGIFFCSRPRRFGKSLTVSALKCVFQGKRHLFEGLYIDKQEYDWKKYPVLHLDFGDIKNDTPEAFKAALFAALSENSEILNIEIQEKTYPELAFRELILKAARIEKVVILVDEYDKPLLDNLDNPALEEIRTVLEGFYSVIKGTNEHQRFVFMTGVTKFSKVSVFSKLNNLRDITMEAAFATMFGYTQEELEENFGPELDVLAGNAGVDPDAFRVQVKQHYNGYRFEERAATVYNPVSIGQFIGNRGKFLNFWFATGSPSFLIRLSKKMEMDITQMLEKPVQSLAFDSFEVNTLSLLPLLVQTGYLTIVGSETEFNETSYWLGFPNREVERSFGTYLISGFVNKEVSEVGSEVLELTRAVQHGDTEEIMRIMTEFCSRIPYDWHIEREGYYNTIFYCIFRLLGLNLRGEVHTNRGRIDAVLEGKNDVYIFEFKINQPADVAIEQIQKMGYHEPFLASDKKIHLVGVSFDTTRRNIGEFKQLIINN